MFCPNCGKEVKENDNFCRFCGINLKDDYNVLTKPAEQEDNQEYSEEIVLYDVKKHILSLFWSIILTPVFFIYFWTIFLNTHSLFSWVIVIAIIAFIAYPILRYNSDKIIITNKFAHVKTGVLNPIDISIPVNELDNFELVQSSLGKICNYGNLSYIYNGSRIDYGYIEEPEAIQYIINDTKKFIKETMS